MKTEIYLIRHGQSEGNLRDLFLGHTDMDLTDLGRKQAQRASTYFDEIHVDAIFSSDLLRAYHTACPLAEKKGIAIVKNEKLREIFAGEWEGLVFSDILRDYPEGKVWWEDTGNSRPTGGESVAELQERVLSEVTRLAEENAGKTICIFTHFTPIYALRTAWAGVPLSEMKNIPRPSNACVTHVTYENGSFEVLEYAVNDYLAGLECPNRA